MKSERHAQLCSDVGRPRQALPLHLDRNDVDVVSRYHGQAQHTGFPGREGIRRLEELLRRAQENIAVAVGAEEATDQCPPICHANAHSLVEQRLQLLPSAHSRRVRALPI